MVMRTKMERELRRRSGRAKKRRRRWRRSRRRGRKRGGEQIRGGRGGGGGGKEQIQYLFGPRLSVQRVGALWYANCEYVRRVEGKCCHHKYKEGLDERTLMM
jgi:hypothetical protein